jgi:hypothetical protein
MARHLKEASPVSWNVIRSELGAYPNPWVPDDINLQRAKYPNAAEFILQVDSAPPCVNCTDSLQFQGRLIAQDISRSIGGLAEAIDDQRLTTRLPQAVRDTWNRLGSLITGRAAPRQDPEMGPEMGVVAQANEPGQSPAPPEPDQDNMPSRSEEPFGVPDASTAPAPDEHEASTDELSPPQELSRTDDAQLASGSVPPDSGGRTQVDTTADATRLDVRSGLPEAPLVTDPTREGSTAHFGSSTLTRKWAIQSFTDERYFLQWRVVLTNETSLTGECK